MVVCLNNNNENDDDDDDDDDDGDEGDDEDDGDEGDDVCWLNIVLFGKILDTKKSWNCCILLRLVMSCC